MKTRMLAMLAAVVLAAGGLAAAAPTAALADSGWRCTRWVAITDPDARVCIRTIRKDSTHISGVDISYNRSYLASGCVTIRFRHTIELGYGEQTAGTWADNGAVGICPSEARSFFWTHAGAGAYLPSGWNVYGWFTFYPPVSPQLSYQSPRIWHPNH